MLEQEERPLELEEGLLEPSNWSIVPLDEKIQGSKGLHESSVGLFNPSVKLILPCEASGQSWEGVTGAMEGDHLSLRVSLWEDQICILYLNR